MTPFANGQTVIDKSGEKYTYVGPYPNDKWFAVVLDGDDVLQAVLVQYLSLDRPEVADVSP